MNVASKELCQELHKLSDWNDTEFIYYANGGVINDNVEYRQMVFDKPDHLPAYDCGYLLRKLPTSLEDNEGVPIAMYNGGEPITLIHLEDGSGKWLAEYHGWFWGQADKPEDALALLAIRLFEQKILTREQV